MILKRLINAESNQYFTFHSSTNRLVFDEEDLLQIKHSAKKKVGSVFVDLIAANDTLYGTATSSAKLFVHGQHTVCAIATSPSQLELALKK